MFPLYCARDSWLFFALSLLLFRLLRLRVNPGEYYYKTSMEHELALDFEEQLMIVQELKDQGLVRLCPLIGAGKIISPSRG